MASNSALIAVKDRGRLNGYGTLLQKENHQWWGTWQWAIQILIWMAIVNGMLAMIALAAPKIEAAQNAQQMSQAEASAAKVELNRTALMVFFVFMGFAPAVGVVIMGQEAVIQERQTGTAAWVLSKPVSRASFLLSKLTADAVGILVTMVLAQGLAAYFIYKAGTGVWLSIPGFLAGLGLVYLAMLFYLALTVMLGTLFLVRGPVIGIPMVLIFGSSLNNIAPFLGKILPWNLTQDVGLQGALAVTLSQGQPLPTLTPILGTAVLTILFIAVALWRFEREEF